MVAAPVQQKRYSLVEYFTLEEKATDKKMIGSSV